MTGNSRHGWSDERTRIAALCREAAETGLLVPVELGGSEEAFWVDCDLASCAENRLGDRTLPEALDAVRRRHWETRAVLEPPWPPSARSYNRCGWLTCGGERAGTIALATSPVAGNLLRVSSLYVLPPYRGRGVARGALFGLRNLVGRYGFGISLSTAWCWPQAVRYYLRLGLWVRLWKRDPEFCFAADAPAPLLELGPDSASLGILHQGTVLTLASARRAGDTLLSFEAVYGEGPPHSEYTWCAESTLSLALALEGWPLVRSAELLERARLSDGGPPESLARKIPYWEAWAHECGWQVPTRRIPGLAYPRWQDV